MKKQVRLSRISLEQDEKGALSFVVDHPPNPPEGNSPPSDPSPAGKLGNKLAAAMDAQPDFATAHRQLKEALNRALNTWENRPDWLVSYVDGI